MKYRDNLPQLNGKDVSAMGGVETWLEYADGLPLRHFCAFEWLREATAKQKLEEFHRREIEAVTPHGLGMIVEGIHYRASRDWGDLCGYSRDDLRRINEEGIALYRALADQYDSPDTPMVVGGDIGPRGDAYKQGRKMTAEEAEEYHSEQIGWLKEAGADMITAVTFSQPQEAIGLTRAARAHGMPVAVSFFTDGQGRLSTGQSFAQGVAEVDAATESGPAYYLINCAHPLEFAPALDEPGWTNRLGGVMPNASAKDKISLCQLGHLEDGDPEELGHQIADIARRFPHARVWGGCCGTDARHLGQIARRVSEARNEAA